MTQNIQAVNDQNNINNNGYAVLNNVYGHFQNISSVLSQNINNLVAITHRANTSVDVAVQVDSCNDFVDVTRDLGSSDDFVDFVDVAAELAELAAAAAVKSSISR